MSKLVRMCTLVADMARILRGREDGHSGHEILDLQDRGGKHGLPQKVINCKVGK